MLPSARFPKRPAEFPQNKFRFLGIPTAPISIPAVFPQHLSPFRWISRGICGIPAIPVPVQTATQVSSCEFMCCSVFTSLMYTKTIARLGMVRMLITVCATEHVESQLRYIAKQTVSSCWSSHSERPHRCCHLPNNFDSLGLQMPPKLPLSLKGSGPSPNSAHCHTVTLNSCAEASRSTLSCLLTYTVRCSALCNLHV